MISQNINIRNHTLRVWTGGSGPGLLLLHSAWGDAELSWSRVWGELAASFTVVAPDMPGFGGSGPVAPIPLAESVRLLAGLLDQLKLDRVVVAGNSFGVALSVEFALAFPDRTAHLVVVNGGYLPPIPSLFKKIIAIPAIEKRFRVFMRKMVYSEKAFDKAFPNKQLLPEGFFECIRNYEERHSRAVYDSFMLQAQVQTPPKVPTTVIWGTGDRLLTPKQTERIRKWFHEAAVVPLHGAGHLPQLEQPTEFAATIKTAAKGR